MDNFWQPIQYHSWATRWRHGNESLEEFWRRQAKAVAKVEENKKYWEEQFYNILKDFKFTPGGRIAANVGTGLSGKTLMNCYINSPPTKANISYSRFGKNGSKIPCKIVTEDSPDSLHNIFLTLLEQAKTLASDGGYGINISFIRPRGSLIKGINIRHPGVVKYMTLWDKVSDVIVAGDNDGFKKALKSYLSDEEIEQLRKEVMNTKLPRKGAMMIVLNCDHPDIEEFILCKREMGQITKANISVGITDAFMEAVEKDELWDLKFDGKIYERVRARDLYDLIVRSSWKYNDPGIVFIDHLNKSHPLYYIQNFTSTNPCGEVPGGDVCSTVCLLGSLNLTKFVKVVNNTAVFDWREYKETIRIAVRFLDNVNDLEVGVLPQYNWAVKNLRQFGLGINGLGSCLAMLGITYGDNEECIKFVEELNRVKLVEAYKASIDLAREKGPFPAFDYKNYCTTPFFKNFLDRFPEIKSKIRKYGIRNGTITTNPPLGNSSVIVGTSNGIEPIYSPVSERAVIVSWPEGLTREYIKDNFKQEKIGKDIVWKGKYNGKSYLWEPHNRGLCEIIKVEDYSVVWLRENGIKGKVMAAKDVSLEGHLAVMKATQDYVEQSVSKTINLPASFKLNEMKDLFMRAWKMGLKGLTTYREGTMAAVIKSIEERPRDIIRQDIKLPSEFINGPTHIVRADKSKFYIHLSYLPEDTERKFPIAIWIKTNRLYKSTSSVDRLWKKLMQLAQDSGIDRKYIESTYNKCKSQAVIDKLARAISLNLRHNVSISKILKVLDSEGKQSNIGALINALKKFLARHITDEEDVITCPECNNKLPVIHEGGCVICTSCGWTPCM